MPEPISGTVAFFKAMAPVLTANVLTVTFVYCFAKDQPERAQGRGRGSPHLPLADCPSVPVHAVWPLRVGRLSA